MGAEPARSRRQAVVHFAGMMPSNRADDESDVGKARPSPLGFRPDLEGVRAVAVALVLLSHFINWPTGGFIGVDVFFVLSGFLITGLLLKEYDRTGRISFRSFYIRRIKRILPASTLVIVVTALAVYTVFLGARVQQAVVDGGWALAFAANWRFVLAGQDYFAIDRAVSPFQHYWSLAVEEQFYLVWPLLVVLSIFLAARLGAHERYRPALALTLGGLTVASFVWACAETASAPTTAYFSTFSRAWELGAGGLLALLASSRHLRVPWPRTMSVAGLAVIVGSSVLLDPTWAFPGPWAVLPVVGTLLVVYSGIGVDSTRLNPLLTNHVSRYVGRISFSLYLWHWPVVVVLTGVMGTGSLRFYAGGSPCDPRAIGHLLPLRGGSGPSIDVADRGSASPQGRSPSRAPAAPLAGRRDRLPRAGDRCSGAVGTGDQRTGYGSDRIAERGRNCGVRGIASADVRSRPGRASHRNPGGTGSTGVA